MKKKILAALALVAVIAATSHGQPPPPPCLPNPPTNFEYLITYPAQYPDSMQVKVWWTASEPNECPDVERYVLNCSPRPEGGGYWLWVVYGTVKTVIVPRLNSNFLVRAEYEDAWGRTNYSTWLDSGMIIPQDPPGDPENSTGG